MKAAPSSTPSLLWPLELDIDAADSHEAAAASLRCLLAGRASKHHRVQALLRDAEAARERALSPAGEVDLQAFAQALADARHLIWVRTGRPSSSIGLRHTFCVAAVPAAGGSDDAAPAGDAGSSQPPSPPSELLLVVDPAFRDSFLLPNPTPSYTALIDALPDMWCGTAEQLVPLVEFMCHQMQLVFAETASSCPPWRQASSMLSRWLPSAVDDVPVCPRGACDAAAGAGAGAGAADGQAGGGDAMLELSSRSSSGRLSSGGGGGLSRRSSGGDVDMSRGFAAILTNNHAAGNAAGGPGAAAAAAAAAAADAVYTPRAAYFERGGSPNNILLVGSMERLGGSGMLGLHEACSSPAGASWGAQPAAATCIVAARHGGGKGGAAWQLAGREPARPWGAWGSPGDDDDAKGVAIKPAGGRLTPRGRAPDVDAGHFSIPALHASHGGGGFGGDSAAGAPAPARAGIAAVPVHASGAGAFASLHSSTGNNNDSHSSLDISRLNDAGASQLDAPAMGSDDDGLAAAWRRLPGLRTRGANAADAGSPRRRASAAARSGCSASSSGSFVVRQTSALSAALASGAATPTGGCR